MGLPNDQVVGVDALLNNRFDLSTLKRQPPVVVYDDDHYYLASVLAEKIVTAGLECTYITPSPLVASWTTQTLEQSRIQARLLTLGVNVITNHRLSDIEEGMCHLCCVYTDRIIEQPLQALIPVTARVPNDGLWQSLQDKKEQWQAAGISGIKSLGDCYAPGLIAAAVHAGHAYGRSVALDEAPQLMREDSLFKNSLS